MAEENPDVRQAHLSSHQNEKSTRTKSPQKKKRSALEVWWENMSPKKEKSKVNENSKKKKDQFFCKNEKHLFTSLN